jgi:phospholipid/cholesterol/gamma-HCH transport system permease protein
MVGQVLPNVDRLGQWALDRVAWAPASALLVVSALRQGFWGHGNARGVQLQQARRQVFFTGVQALPMVATISVILGATLIIESLPNVPKVGAETMLSTIWVHVVVRELGPLLAGLIVAGRTGGAVTAELGCMQASGEIEALRAMAIDPVAMLVVPRILGITAATLGLTIYLALFTIAAGALAALAAPWITGEILVYSLISALSLKDLAIAVVKGLFFGLAISSIACHRGLQVSHTITEVPLAVGDTVVRCILVIMFINGLLSLLWFL